MTDSENTWSQVGGRQPIIVCLILIFSDLLKIENNTVAECSGKQKAAISHLVTVRKTIDVPQDNINSLLTLLWNKATLKSEMIICGPNKRRSLDANQEGSCLT